MTEAGDQAGDPPDRSPPSALGRAVAGLHKALDSFDRLTTLEQAGFLTLPLLLLYVDNFWYVNVPVVGLALAGLLFSTARRSSLFWFTLTCFLAAGVFYNWHVVDNHKYLLCYWTLALVVSASLADGGRSLAVSARWLIGLTFAFASYWKLVSPDFLSGDFFHYSLLFDPRFSGKLQALGWVDPSLLELNEVAHRALISYDSHLDSVQLATVPGLDRLALGLTWWSLALEAAIALAFLVPRRARIAGLRHGLLIVFVVSTYAVAPVIGFGWLLVAMGFVQCDRSRRKTRLLYLLSLLLLQAFRLPWSSISRAVTG